MSYPPSPSESGATTGPPGYQTSPYPPPASPGTGYPVPPPVPPRKSNALKIVLIVLATVLLICGGIVGLAAFLLKDKVNEVVEATQVRLVAPETLAGMPKNNSAELQPLADALSSELKSSVPQAGSTVAAFYGDLEKQELLMLAGVSGLLADPKAELEEAIEGSSTEMLLTNIRTVDAGPQGGTARCGDGEVEEIKVGLCIWADRGSLVMYVYYFSSGEKAAAELVRIRAAVEQKE